MRAAFAVLHGCGMELNGLNYVVEMHSALYDLDATSVRNVLAPEARSGDRRGADGSA